MKTLRDLLRLSRPIYAGSILVYYGIGLLFIEYATPEDAVRLVPALLGAAGALAAVGSVFALNTLCDLDTDATNPSKGKDMDLRANPLLAGRLTKGQAAAWAAGTALLSLGLFWLAEPRATIAVAALLVVTVLYSAPPLRLKGKPVVDVLGIASHDVCLFGAGMLIGAGDLWPCLDLILFVGLFSIATSLPTICQDTEPDRAAGLRTTSVVFGDPAAHAAALVFSLAGASIGIGLGVARYEELWLRVGLGILVLVLLAGVLDYIVQLKKHGLPLRSGSDLGPWYGWAGHAGMIWCLVMAVI